ncbi:hypothetical protein E8E14_008921 [Neopestalotiopsis sp. 37M]|nr:hypothetical protein E8E14_008921 [Neopestalotiopsis sp. 37M]
MIDLLIEQRNFDAIDSLNPSTDIRYGGGLKVFLHGQPKQELVGKILVNEAPQETSQSEAADTSWDPVYSRGRMVPPIINLDLVRAWVKFCCSNHEKCRRFGNGIPAAFRLIDLEHFQVIEATTNWRYVALSYVWGTDTKPLLTQERLSEFLQEGGLRHADIPQTILDAMQVSRDIGYRYLWVDSICIVQDDANDKIKQLPIMGKIYSEADLVIVAAMGVSAHTGLSGIGKNTRNQWQHIEKLDEYRFITTGKDIPKIVGGTYWNSRGWTFQEAYLARRVLLFAQTQVFWICQDITWREDTNLESPRFRSFESRGLESLWGSDSDDNTLIVFDNRCRTREYCRNVELFSLRTFKDESDTLWAYAGVLQAQSALFPQGYIWGVPYEILDVALLVRGW